MAGTLTVTISLLTLPRTLAATRVFSSSLSSSKCYSIMGFNPLSRRTAVLPSRKLVIRAARAESKGVSLGFRAPDFELPEPLTGNLWKLEDFEPYPALLVMFICNHCPFVKHLKKDVVKLSNFYMKKGLAVIAISSNSVTTHPQDGPDYMAEDAKVFKYPFPYLYDESQDVARNFGAVCTPEFFLFKKDGRRPFELVYHGQFDDSRPSSNVPITGRDLSLAIDRVLSGQPVNAIQKPRMENRKLQLTFSPVSDAALSGILNNAMSSHFQQCLEVPGKFSWSTNAILYQLSSQGRSPLISKINYRMTGVV